MRERERVVYCEIVIHETRGDVNNRPEFPGAESRDGWITEKGIAQHFAHILDNQSCVSVPKVTVIMLQERGYVEG